MNPFIFPALMVLCVCSVLTERILSSAGLDQTGIVGALFAIPMTATVWTIAACMLASIGLGATTGTGARGAVVTTVVSALLVAYVIYRRRKGAMIQLLASLGGRRSESVRAEDE
jgi:hypothetical protein